MNNSTVIIIFDTNYIIRINHRKFMFDIAKIFLNIFGDDANYSYS